MLAFALWSRSILRSLESGRRRPPGLFEHPTLGTNAAPLLSWRHMGAGWVRGRWPSSRDAPEGIVHPQPTPTACALLSASQLGWGQPLLRPATVLACCVALSWVQYMPLRGIVRDHHAPRKTGLRLLIYCLWRARAEGSRQGDGKQVGTRPGSVFWPLVAGRAGPTGRQSRPIRVPYDISRRWKRCSTRSERAWVSETPNPASLRLVERPAFRARAPIRSTRIESKATKQASKATGVRAFYWLGRGIIVSHQEVSGKVTHDAG